MNGYASKKYSEIITFEDDVSGILRTPTCADCDLDWSCVDTIVSKLLFVRNEILKGGAGLAAPQIGFNYPVFIYTPDRTTENLRVVVNPSMIPLDQTCVEGSEACFSLPQQCVKLKRWKKIKVIYQNEKKAWLEDILEGFSAKVFQHEMDHLEGRLIIDHPNADVKKFNLLEEFEAHMKYVHLEDSKSYLAK